MKTLKYLTAAALVFTIACAGLLLYRLDTHAVKPAPKDLVKSDDKPQVIAVAPIKVAPDPAPVVVEAAPVIPPPVPLPKPRPYPVSVTIVMHKDPIKAKPTRKRHVKASRALKAKWAAPEPKPFTLEGLFNVR